MKVACVSVTGLAAPGAARRRPIRGEVRPSHYDSCLNESELYLRLVHLNMTESGPV